MNAGLPSLLCIGSTEYSEFRKLPYVYSVLYGVPRTYILGTLDPGLFGLKMHRGSYSSLYRFQALGWAQVHFFSISFTLYLSLSFRDCRCGA
jgi:hypothetical protein